MISSAQIRAARALLGIDQKQLAEMALKLEEHYGKPQDIEFAIAEKEIWIVQSRPITTKAVDAGAEIEGDALLSGLAASPGIASGTVRVIKDLSELDKVKPGDILVTEMTNPDMVVTMQKSAAIITDEGGVTSHAAIVSREMGIPAIVGTGDATKKLHDGEVVTVDGNTGKVFEGRSETKIVEIEEVVPTKTKIKVIVDLPDFAERAARAGVNSVGLVRIEGIIASSGKHPLKFVKEDRIEDYVQLLSDGLSKIALPFNEIWVRSSDIRSDEFRNLEGAPEEAEGNPMLGDHGIRFGLRHPKILKAELQAIKEVADSFHNKKIGIMVPVIIGVDELKEVKRIAREEVGIPKNVRIGIMVETPASVQLINDFCEEGIDFVSFGTNDLTQFTLAVDRNNGDVQYLFDEMHPAVLNSIKYVIRRCKHYNVETSICGQAGSREEMARFLVDEGIDSITVNADAAEKISRLVARVEGGKVSEPVSEPENLEKNIELIEKEKKKYERSVEKKVEEKWHKKPVEIPVQHLRSPEIMEQDIEEVLMKELEDTLEGTSDYSPGLAESDKEDIPNLNESIPIESEDLNEKNNTPNGISEEIDMSREVGESEPENEKEEIKDNGEKKDNIGMSEDEDDEPEPDEPDVEPEPFPLEDKKISDDDDDDEEDDDDDDFFEKSDDSYEDEKLADDESYTVEEIEEEKPKEEATWESRDDEDIKLDIF